jgi:hypothetical protein
MFFLGSLLIILAFAYFKVPFFALPFVALFFGCLFVCWIFFFRRKPENPQFNGDD